MSLKQQVTDLFNQEVNTNPLTCLEKIRDFLRDNCEDGKVGDPFKFLDGEEVNWEAIHAYIQAADLFDHNYMYGAGESLLLEKWDELASRQSKHKKRIYRAGIALRLAGHYSLRNMQGVALRWDLLTQADDLLGKHREGGGGSKQRLITIYGMHERHLKLLNEKAKECILLVEQDNDWSKPEAFAEEVIRRFAEEDETSYLYSNAEGIYQFPLTTSYFRSLKDRVDDWESLEKLASYLVLLLPGCVPRLNVLEKKKVHEIDVVARNFSHASSITSELLGRHFIIECKNWSRPIGVPEVGWFLQRIRLTHAQFGIIFSRKGITGKQQQKAATELIRRTFHEDGSICIVLDEKDLTELAKGEQSFWWMLVQKIEALRFG